MITELFQRRRQALQELEETYIKSLDAPGMQKNKEMHLNQYLEICKFGNMKAFPATEFKL